MEPHLLRSFTERYLEHNDCQIIENAPTHIISQLSVQADKDLLNRPFYWTYVEKMGMTPQPAQYCFIFDAENSPPDLRGEYLFYGSPRFTQILQSAQKHGRFVRLYQEPTGWSIISKQSQSYLPWLVCHFHVSYICDRKKERLSLIAMNLHSGVIEENFAEVIKNTKWTPKLPAQRYTLGPRMTIAEAVGELEYYLQDQIQQEDLTWAEEAKERLDQELAQLDSYYPDEEKLDEEQRKVKAQRKREIVWQYHPRVEIKLANAGLFYREPVRVNLFR